MSCDIKQCDICWQPGFLFILCGRCKGSIQGCHLSCLRGQSICPTCRSPILLSHMAWASAVMMMVALINVEMILFLVLAWFLLAVGMGIYFTVRECFDFVNVKK